MKNLNEFKTFDIPKEFMKFLKGGGRYCDALDGCQATAIRDGNEFLIQHCNAAFGAECAAETD